MSKKKPVTVDLFDGSYEEDQQAILDGLEAARRNHPVDPDEGKLLDLLSMYDKIHPSKFDFEKETWLPSQNVMLVPQGKDALDVIAAPYYKEPLFPFTDEQLEELNADKILEPLYEKILSIFDDNATLPFLGKGFQNIKARVAALDWKKIETYFNEKALVRVNELTMQAHTGRAQAADDLPRLCNTVKLFASLYAWQELFRLTEAQQDLEEAAEKGKDVTAACVDLSTELKKVGHSHNAIHGHEPLFDSLEEGRARALHRGRRMGASFNYPRFPTPYTVVCRMGAQAERGQEKAPPRDPHEKAHRANRPHR